MRSLALLSAAVALVSAAPAFAQGGYVGVSYSNIEFVGIDTDAWAVAGAAAVGSNFQIDGRYASQDVLDIDSVTIGGHLFSRGPQWLWGGYLGYTNADDTDEFTVAAETQFYLDRTTLSGAGAYSNIDDADLGIWSLDGEVRHFATDNFSIQGNLGWFNAESGGASEDGWNGGVGGEFQFTGAPVSVHGGYQHTEFGGLDADSWGIGVRVNWGGTLLERNRSGASLNRPTLPFVERLFGQTSPR